MLKLFVYNNDKSASVVPPFKLVDAEGREYEESSKGMLLSNSFGALKNLNPDVSSIGIVVFDVPHDRNYALRVSGGFASSETALIDLP